MLNGLLKETLCTTW